MANRPEPLDPVAEGPYMDTQGRECLGVWAEEGGRLLVLRRDAPNRISFHVGGDFTGGPGTAVTVAAFRWQRIRDFIEEEVRNG